MVNKNTLLIKSNLNKSLKQIIAVALLVILTSALLYITFYLSTDYNKNFDRQAVQLNISDSVIMYSSLSDVDYTDKISEVLDNNDSVEDYRILPLCVSFGNSEFGKDGILSCYITLESYTTATNRRYDNYEILEQDNTIDKDGVYLSYIYKVAAGYKLGDSIVVRINDTAYDLTVQGFYNSLATGTTNCGDISFIVSDEKMAEIASNNNPSYKVILMYKDDVDESSTVQEVNKQITAQCPGLSYIKNVTPKDFSGSRYVNAEIFKTVLLLASIIMIIVLLSAIAIVLSNYIKNNIVNFGILKSIGYTSRSLIVPLIIEFAVIVTVSSIIGVALAYPVLPVINNALESQIGIPYTIKFLFTPALLSVLCCLVLSVLVTYLSVIKIKRIYPINAIRENKNKTEINKIALSLAKSKLSLNTFFGLNIASKNIVTSIVVFLTFIGISFLLGFSCFIYQNLVVDSSGVITLVCGQQPPSSLISVTNGAEDELKSILDENNDVESYYMYSMQAVIPKDKKKITLYVIENTTNLAGKTVLLEGKFPTDDNEISINKKVASTYHLSIGDQMEFLVNDEIVAYNIVGLTQGALHGGDDAYMQVGGYRKLCTPMSLSYNINLKDGVDIDEFNNSVRAKMHIVYCCNQEKFYDSMTNMYSQILAILGIVIALLSFLIIAFVLYILLSILLNNRKRENGILKSIGFVSKDLILQTQLSILPLAVLGSFVGFAISRKGVPSLLEVLLASMGIFRFGNPIDVTYLLLIGVITILLTALYIVLLARPIRKISPHELFNRE